MPRVKRGVIHLKNRRKILSGTKGFMWGRKSKISLAKIARTKAGAHAYRGRKLKKRLNRGIWQLRIGAAARTLGTSYSQLIGHLRKAEVTIDRKILARLAADHPAVFAKIVEVAKK